MLNERYAGLSFQEACASGNYLIGHSTYAENLEFLYSHFPHQQILVFLYDDVCNDPSGMLVNVFEFLDVDSTFQPSGLTQIRNRIIFPQVQRTLSRMHLTPVVELVKKTPLGTAIKRWSKRRATDGQQARDIKQQIDETLRRDFCDDIVRVQELIGRDLSHWLH